MAERFARARVSDRGCSVIWRPRIGQRVVLHYSRSWRRVVPFHGAIGTVRVAARGPGPHNIGVELGDGQMIVVPRGNLVAAESKSAGLFSQKEPNQ